MSSFFAGTAKVALVSETFSPSTNAPPCSIKRRASLFEGHKPDLTKRSMTPASPENSLAFNVTLGIESVEPAP